MWTARTEPLPRGLRVTLDSDGRSASFAAVLTAWRGDDDFCTFFNALLAGAPFTAYRFETPGMTTETRARPFEFALLDDPGLARPADASAFATHFAADPSVVIAFENLSGDALLVVPRPAGDRAAYAHLAAFARLAPAPQRVELWRRVGEEMGRRVGAAPVWLSTAGAGVPWLHVRLDARPKYYAHAPYRAAPA